MPCSRARERATLPRSVSRPVDWRAEMAQGQEVQAAFNASAAHIIHRREN